jgi:hypothetical protein
MSEKKLNKKALIIGLLAVAALAALRFIDFGESYRRMTPTQNAQADERLEGDWQYVDHVQDGR